MKNLKNASGVSRSFTTFRMTLRFDYIPYIGLLSSCSFKEEMLSYLFSGALLPPVAGRAMVSRMSVSAWMFFMR